MKKVLLLALLCLSGSAQHQHPEAPAEKPVALWPGLGIWSHPIATASPEAQKFFDQGLVLLYGFNRYESLRSFRKAAELDPRAAMPLWGVAMALGPYVNMDGDPSVQLKESCEAVESGLRLAGNSPDRAWLQAAGTRCPDFADPGRYIQAMRDLAAALPDDPDAQTLYAESLMLPCRWRWYDAEGKPAAGMPEAERVLEAVLRRFPNHPGANHYYIHAVESSPTPERAVPSAQRLMGIVPSAGHMVHMPGHIWLALGDYNNAVAVNERAAEVDRSYFARSGVMGSYYPYYLHNLSFILYARAMQGRAAETIEARRQMLEAAGPIAQSMPEMLDTIKPVIRMALLRVGRWDEVLAEAPPASESGVDATFRRHARAIALAAKGDAEAARREQEQFETLLRKADGAMPWGANKLGPVLELASAQLTARLEATPARAVPLWKHAVDLQDRLAYDEPPAWYYPLRESLGAALVRAGDAATAEQVFREGLRRSPNNGRMLFGLLETLRLQHKTEAARWVEREFQAAWRDADVKLRIEDL
jgi:tetratricopeptide (TPR) repeat protein